VTGTVNSGLFGAGETLVMQKRGGGRATITAGTATVNTSASLALAQYSAGTLYFVSDSAALFFGDAAGISASIVDAKGDLIVGTADNTVGRLAVGTNGHILTADSTVSPTGLKWAAPAAGGGKTLLSTTSLTSTGVSISVSQSYKDLEIWVYKVSLTGQAGPSFKDNNLPGTYYSFLREGSASSAAGRTDVYLPGSGDLNTGADAGNWVIYVYNYTSSERKIFNFTGQLRAFSDNTDRSIFGGGYMDSTAALTDLSIFATGGPTFDGGFVKVYGVN